MNKVFEWLKGQKNFWKWLKAAGVRALKTMAETALALIGTNTIGAVLITFLPELNQQLMISRLQNLQII